MLKKSEQKELNFPENFVVQNHQEFVKAVNQINHNLTKIQGSLTSRIEFKGEKTSDPYHYAFLQLEDKEFDIPVIFRTKSETKPNILVGSLLELEGNWAETKESQRASFTAYSYQIISVPKPPTIQTLTEKLQKLIPLSCKEKEKWTQTTDFLFKKQAELKELKTLSKFGKPYLKAYLLLKSAHYANYQTEHLSLTNFDQDKYLKTLAFEIERTANKIEAQQRKAN